MDSFMTTPVRALVAATLCATLGACAIANGPELRAVAPDKTLSVSDRFSSDGRVEEKTTGTHVSFEGLEADAPDVYTVVRGDTLWDISDKFLKDPWLWPKLWGFNSQIENPHLIYPGDRLALETINGYPRLVLTRNGNVVNEPRLSSASDGNAPNGVVEKLSPRIRSESLDDAIPMIAGDAIAAFLVHPRVVDLETIENAPYIMGSYDRRLISAVGHQVYARGDISRERTRYGIFRKGTVLRDPVTREILGHEVTHIANAKLMNVGDPSTLSITSNKLETMKDDFLLPVSEDGITHTYVPRLPAIEGEGRIVSLTNAIARTGRDQVVTINVGSRSGIAVGDVLAVEARGDTVIDNRGKRQFEKVKLPNQRTGVLMVFKTFEKVSYGLVMESSRPISINDIVSGI